MFVPWDPSDLQMVGVFGERHAQLAAVLLHGVGWLIAAPEESDDSLAAHFSTRKLPIASASIPELKKVRKASVGV